MERYTEVYRDETKLTKRTQPGGGGRECIILCTYGAHAHIQVSA